MSPAVTYNGVRSDEGGNIFKDVKFWVATRVPIRKEILDSIQNNGGIVVPLEKNADMLIADHIRKDAPSGSYSWKYITDSVENGFAQLEDRYLIGPDPSISRPAGTSAPTKTTRTPFTDADDAALAKWVLSQDADYTGGNKLYMALEKANNRHTWQSWRNRYVKKLMLLPPQQLQRLAASAPNVVIQVSNEELTGSSSRHPTRASVSTGNIATPPVLDDSAERRPREAPAALSPRRNTRNIQRAEPSPPKPNAEDEATRQMREQFYSDLNDYMLANDLNFEKHQRICGKEIELWDLGQVVGSQNVPVDDVEWIRVAEEMQYASRKQEDAATALQICYEEHLLEFLEAMSSFPADLEDDEHAIIETDEESEAVIADSYPAPPSPRSRVPPSPSGNVAGRKRALEPELPSTPDHAQKRRRKSARTEIESTPDIQAAAVGPSPSLGQSSLGRTGRFREIENSQQLPTLREAFNNGTLSSELRYFDNQSTPQSRTRLERRQSSFDVTPSQQLQSEHLDSDPIPLVLPKGRTDSAALPQRSVSGTTAQRGSAKTSPSRVASRAAKRSLPASFGAASKPESAKKPETEVVRERRESDVTDEDRRRRLSNHEDNQQQINQWIEYYQALGYPHRIVVEALKRTTMTPGGLAGEVMQSLKDGKGVPTHHEGVWTDRDDDSLRYVDWVGSNLTPAHPQQVRQRNKAKKEWDRLMDKHGEDRIDLRRKFLDAEVAANAPAQER